MLWKRTAVHFMTIAPTLLKTRLMRKTNMKAMTVKSMKQMMETLMKKTKKKIPKSLTSLANELRFVNYIDHFRF